jgi:Protein of unknown function (DUF1573)
MKSGGIPVLLAALAVLAVPVLADDAPPPAAGHGKAPAHPHPKAVLASLEHDFGKQKPGTPIEYRFEVKNEGDAVLEIRGVKPSCGCTTASFDSTVAPGKTGGITLAVKKTDVYKGGIAKGATVLTNDPDLSSFHLTLRADFGTE